MTFIRETGEGAEVVSAALAKTPYLVGFRSTVSSGRLMA